MSQASSYTRLTRAQRIYVDCRLDGMTQKASAMAAGSKTPTHFEDSATVQAVLIERMQTTADEVDFGRKEAHEMYMEAYRNAETAMEQVAAVNAMVKLHGLEKPKVLEIKHDHSHHGQLEFMPTEQLMKLANMEDIILDGEYEDVTDVPTLGAPEATDDNTADTKEMPTVSEDY